MYNDILPLTRPSESEANPRKQARTNNNNEGNLNTMNLFIKTFEEIKPKKIKCFYKDCTNEVSSECLDDRFLSCRTHIQLHLEEDKSQFHKMKYLDMNLKDKNRDKFVNCIKSYNSDLRILKKKIASKVAGHIKKISREMGHLFKNIDAMVSKNKHKMLELTCESQEIFFNMTPLDQYKDSDFHAEFTKETHKIEISKIISDVIRAEINHWNAEKITKNKSVPKIEDRKPNPKLPKIKKEKSEFRKISHEKSNLPLLHWCEWKTNRVHYFDFTQNKQMSIAFDNLVIPNHSSSISIYHNKIFLCGGWNDNKTPKSNENYSQVIKIDLKRKSFRYLSPMITGRVDFCMTYMFGLYYVFGGYDYKGRTIASCERYSLKINGWQIIPKLNSQRRLATCVAVPKQNCIFIMGGLEKVSDDFNNIIEKYDAALNVWNMIKINKSILGCLMGAFSMPDSSLIFVFGGLNKDEEFQKDCWFFNYETNNVNEASPLSSDLSYMQNMPVLYDNKIYCYSLISDSERQLSFYDIQSGVWSIKS